MCQAKTFLLVLCFNVFVVEVVYGFSTNGTRIRRQSNSDDCSSTEQFRCKSGQCIHSDKECDGDVDCKDGSDETDACRRIKCPSFLFACDYGACIRQDQTCDGRPDCRDASDENTPDCPKSTQKSQCQEGQFQCGTGQCIDNDLKCDGKAECDDHTDELSATCYKITCPGFTHRCNYGACVNGNAQCNGKVECFDGSDEDPAICPSINTPPPPPVIKPTEKPILRGGCILPEHPNFGRWMVSGSFHGAHQPGGTVPSNSVLKVACDINRKLDGDNTVLCDEGVWSSPIGQCLLVCPTIVSTPTMTVTCIFKDKESENCTGAIDGTLSRFKCAPFYEDFNLKLSPVHICKDGTWDLATPHCVPVCGQKTVEATELIINGANVTKGDYPWQVAIYTRKNKELICGGSLLSHRVVLTAAHCLTDSKGKKESEENYIIAVGKYFRKYDGADFKEAQFSDIYRTFIAPHYRGITQNYLGDMAIVITKKTFILSRRVQPVCLDTGSQYNLNSNQFGYVTGWGFTKENSEPSDVLKEVKVPTVSITECQQGIPEDYEVYLTYDKMCAGYLDEGIAVCKGDSGGGLVFKHEQRYYVTGIVSLSPRSPTLVDGCDSQRYALYTKVSSYIHEILSKYVEYKTN